MSVKDMFCKLMTHPTIPHRLSLVSADVRQVSLELRKLSFADNGHPAPTTINANAIASALIHTR